MNIKLLFSMEFAYLEDTEQDLLKKLAEVCDRRCATAFLHKSVDREERRRKHDEEFRCGLVRRGVLPFVDFRPSVIHPSPQDLFPSSSTQAQVYL